MLFQWLLGFVIRQGSLGLITSKGRRYNFGDGKPPHATIKLSQSRLEWTLAFNPQLRVGEAYHDGLLTIEEGNLRDFLQIVVTNIARRENRSLLRWINRLCCRANYFKQFNPLGRARKNVAHHYDLSPQLYDLFLDPDRQYSCGYFSNRVTTLEQAQLDKKRHIAAKLLLEKPGLRVLDIGSGWGGLGLYLAREAGCNVMGVTLSEEQHKWSQERALRAGFDQRCRFKLCDYREEKGTYDRIVSVGMFEHVGKKNYPEFFAKIRELLAKDGVCLLHSIGDFDEATPINPYIRKYIFPGADLPALSEVLKAVEDEGLFLTDVEILRIHYAETLRHWSERFQARRKEAARLYDERFCRMWEFYLIGCEMAFRYGHLMVFQIQLSKSRNAVPQTRDYMYEEEKRPGLDPASILGFPGDEAESVVAAGRFGVA